MNRFSPYPFAVSLLGGILLFALVSCAESGSKKGSDPILVDIPDTIEVVPLRLDTSEIDLDTTKNQFVTQDDGKGDSKTEPCNDQQKKEIASKRETIADLKKTIAKESDADIKAAMQEELSDSEANLTATLTRFGCDG
jgi:protein subunit release factor A